MLQTGQDFAHFRIVRLLGEGGMGEVYLAEDQKLKRQVALKILLADYFEDSEHLARFEREARTAAQIQNRYVMAIHDIGTAEEPSTRRQIKYIVMEYVKGQSLSEYLRIAKPDIAGIVRLAEKIATGLSAAHKLNIVHRDIKAGNIIIDEEDQPRILDFGLAKPVVVTDMEDAEDSPDTISQELTRMGKIMGTVSYMSPEQARGEAVDARSDVFSFGVLFYYMLTSQFPFQGETQVSILAKILETAHERPSLKGETLPSELERILDKCLQKSRNDRYQDTRDLVVDLRSFRRQIDSGVTDKVSGVVEVVPKKIERIFILRGGKWMALAAVLLALALAIPFTNLFNQSSSPVGGEVVAKENCLAIIGFQNKTGDTELDWLETGLPEILLTDLTQSRTLSIVSYDRIMDVIETSKSNEPTFQEYSNAAEKLGATHILSGTFYKMGEKIRIDARLADPGTGKMVLAEKVIGTDPFSLVDSLSAKVSRSLNVSTGTAGTESVARYTSSSPEAYRNYLEGLGKFETGLFDDAIKAFEKAIAIDSTFALPYMRIGMANAFQGRQQKGAEYFALARNYERNLPVRERSLLDIYANIWLEQKFDDAFTKMEAFVNSYPDDKEGRTIYAIMIYAFAKDTTAAFAQLDTALQLDPSFQLALSQYTNYYQALGILDRAIEFALRIKQTHPDSPDAYRQLASLYTDRKEFQKATNEYNQLLERFPNDASALLALVGLDIRLKSFDRVAERLDQYEEAHGDDPFLMEDCYSWRANLANWKGQFRAGMAWRHKAYQEAVKTGDSTRIQSRLGSISQYYYRWEMPDSGMYYGELGYKYGVLFNKINYPLRLVEHDHTMADRARPLFEKAMKVFRTRMPNELWPLADQVEILFNGYAEADTAMIIAGLRGMSENQSGIQAYANQWEMARFLVLTGKFQEGLEILRKADETGFASVNAWRAVTTLYYSGVAEDGLGDNVAAADHFRQMLRYWGDADIDTKEIRDARKRLARLTS